ncbi:MAG: sensor histidine kinase [Spirulinaceae cyanobacterium]
MYNDRDPVIYPRSQPPYSSESSSEEHIIPSFSWPPSADFQTSGANRASPNDPFGENVPIGIFRLSATGQYLNVNLCFAQWHGYESPASFLADRVESRPGFEVDSQQNKLFLEKLNQEQKVTNFEIARQRRDNTIIWLSFSAQALKDKNNNFYYEGYAFDITAYKEAAAAQVEKERQYQAQAEYLKQIKSQLIQSEKLVSMGKLLAGIAHEINNPVSFIYSNIAPAEEYAQDLMGLIGCYETHCSEGIPAVTAQAEAIDLEFLREDFPKLLTSIKIGAERLNQIVQSLRNFSHFNDQKRQGVNIHKTLDSTLRLLEHRLKATEDRPEIQVIKNYGELPQNLPAYGGLLSQVFMNLLANGIDAIEDSLQQKKGNFKPTIRINTECKENCVIIRIGDNGMGIPPDLRDRIFEAFFTTKPTGKGTGLGLSISHQIITEKHNGQLKCHSQPESGTEFTIELPLFPQNQELSRV